MSVHTSTSSDEKIDCYCPSSSRLLLCCCKLSQSPAPDVSIEPLSCHTATDEAKNKQTKNREWDGVREEGGCRLLHKQEKHMYIRSMLFGCYLSSVPLGQTCRSLLARWVKARPP